MLPDVSEHYVLDASALLCLTDGEAGHGRVSEVLSASVMSAVNLSEAVAQLMELDTDIETTVELLDPCAYADRTLRLGAGRRHGKAESPVGVAVPRLIDHANRFAPATHNTTTPVTAIMVQAIVSCNRSPASSSPKKGWSNCSCPTPAMPPRASPRYQNTKPTSMLKTET